MLPPVSVSGLGIPSRSVGETMDFRKKANRLSLGSRSEEEVKAVVDDDCLLSSQQAKKCDGLSIFSDNKENNKKIYIVLVELKGTDIDTAFEQLTSVKQSQEYREIITCLTRKSNCGKPVKPSEQYLIVTNSNLSRNQQAKPEKHYRIKTKIRTSQKTKALDLRGQL